MLFYVNFNIIRKIDSFALVKMEIDVDILSLNCL
jgi:hypothetical protein